MRNIPASETIIDADRLLLRPWREEDASTLFALASDPLIGPPAGWAPHKNVEESRTVIRTVFSAPGTYCVTIGNCREKGDPPVGTIVGCVGFKRPEKFYADIVRPFKDCSALDLGYWLGHPYWHHGYATLASQAMLEYGFENLGLDAVYATHNTENAASGAVMARLGMRKIGRVAHVPKRLLGTGVFRDEVICRISRQAWESSRREKSQEKDACR